MTARQEFGTATITIERQYRCGTGWSEASIRYIVRDTFTKRYATTATRARAIEIAKGLCGSDCMIVWLKGVSK